MKEVSAKEMLFCRCYAETQNAREAAGRAGYGLQPEKTAWKLLQRPEIRQEIGRLSQQQKSPREEEVTAGLRRIAFGSVADAVRLLFLQEDPELTCLDEMDLFCVSEIKRPKGGGMEIKFCDRLKALERLAELCGSEDSPLPFYQALEKSAQKLG